jgi:hypothetical protein
LNRPEGRGIKPQEIKHFGEFQSVPYGYHITDGYPRDEFMRFNFGGREEILKKRK